MSSKNDMQNKMARPTRTTNRLHFEDLDPRRFEDLVLSLVYRLKTWEELHHDGRTGADRGVDIRGLERLMDDSLRRWAVQCKRYKSFAPADANKVIAEVSNRVSERPDVLLLAVACDVSRATWEAFESNARTHGINTVILWTASKIESMLYNEHKDLLFAFFGVSVVKDERKREMNLKRGLSMKRKLSRIFLAPRPAGVEAPDVIVRSIDDDTYPEVDPAPPGKSSGWFKVEFGSMYYNGIELLLSIREIVVDRSDGHWAYSDVIEDERRALIDSAVRRDPDRFAIENTFTIGRIPFRSIVECDEDGDEYYGGVHLFCRFEESGSPFEQIFQRQVKGYHMFDRDERFEIEDRLPIESSGMQR